MTAQSHSGRRLHRLVLNLLAVAGLAGSLIASPLPAAAATTASSGTTTHGTPQLAGHVHGIRSGQTAQEIAAAAGRPRPTVLAPSRAGHLPTGSSAPVAAGSGHVQVVNSPTPTVVSGSQGTTESMQVSAFGSDQAVSPPDPNIAVGPYWVVEATNQSIYVRNRAGQPFPSGSGCPATTTFTLGGCGSQDLATFLNAPSGWLISDPRVLWDPGSGQFYISLFASTSGPQSVVFVLHSDTGDPTGSWSGFYFDPDYSNVLTDQPMLGFSSDKVTVSWDDFDNAQNFQGDEVKVLNKSTFLADGDPTALVIGTLDFPNAGTPNSTQFSTYPLPQMSPGNTQYLVENDASSTLPVRSGFGPDLWILAVTGNSPSTFAQSGNAYHLPMAATQWAPGMHQPGSDAACDSGGTLCITPDDDRINMGVWQNNILWTGLNEACTPPGGSTVAACIRYIQVNTSDLGTSTNPIQVAADFGINGYDVGYPSFGLDAQKNLVSSFTRSGTSNSDGWASVYALGFKYGYTAPSGVVRLAAGTAVYNDGQTPWARWGDYFSAAMDPSHPTDVWVSGEYMTDGSASGDWATWVGRMTYAAPSIANLTPGAGPTGGGMTVTVNGSDFISGSTFTFAGSSQSISNLTPDSFTFTTPAHAAGPVTATVTSSLGTSNSASFIYVPPSRYQALKPFRVFDTRPAPSCVQCGNPTSGNPINQGESRVVQVAGYTDPNSGESVPAGATAVVLNATSVSPTQGTYLTLYPDNTTRPNASNLNPPAGSFVANLVTVALGSDGAIDVFNALGQDNVILDVAGYYTSTTGASGLFHPVGPYRVCDTRANSGTPCAGGSDNPIGAGQVRMVAVGGGGSPIPTGGTASAVVMNLTAIQGTAGTYLSVYPPDPTTGCSTTAPSTSNLNPSPGVNTPNRVTAIVGYMTGSTVPQVCVYNAQGSINIAIDVNGWYGNNNDTAAGAHFYAMGPSRICDTRAGSGQPCQGLTINGGNSIAVQADGVGGLPGTGTSASPVAVVLNATAQNGLAGTYLTLYPDGQPRPLASDLNPSPHQIVPNLAIVMLPSSGKFDVFNAQGSCDVIIDAMGWFA